MTRRYTVEWARAEESEVTLRCTGLTARVAFARLLKALAHGPIVVHAIRRETT